MQITFAPGATDWRLSGASVYSDAVPSSAEFAYLFDQYRIAGITLRVDMPLMFCNSGVTPVIYPNIYYVADYDDPGDATLVDLLQYPQCQIHQFNEDGYKPLMISLRPKPLRDIAGGGISTGYGPMSTAPWIRTAEMSIPHYGFKLAFDFFNIAQTQDLALVFTICYELEFTNPK